VNEIPISEKATLASVYLEGGRLGIELSGWLLAGTVIAAVAIVVWRIWGGKLRGHAFEIDQAELGLGDQKITLRPNYLDRTVAYKIWVELSTRKIGLSIDPENDVIVEIYDSWFSFFQITRELIKDIPVSKMREPSTEKIIQLSIDLLNNGLRPHLTKWQARFRRWYDMKLSDAGHFDLHPQDIQAKFPAFDEMTKELLEVNERLIIYRDRMRALILAR
jgi:hypothetical protein